MAFDTNPNIFTCLAHDNILLDILPLFNTAPERNIERLERTRIQKAGVLGVLAGNPGVHPGRHSSQ